MTTVLVHPGSLFGSLQTNGDARGRSSSEVRTDIQASDIEPCEHLFVALGDLSGEFRDSPLHAACEEKDPCYIDVPPRRAALRVFGTWVAHQQGGSGPRGGGRMLVTGAWADPQTGCVAVVAGKINTEGREVGISPSAARGPGEKRPALMDPQRRTPGSPITTPREGEGRGIEDLR